MNSIKFQKVSVGTLWNEQTGTSQDLLIDKPTRRRAIIDPYSISLTDATSTTSADTISTFVKRERVAAYRDRPQTLTVGSVPLLSQDISPASKGIVPR